MPKIDGLIRKGKVQLDAEGFVGSSCLETTRAYLEKIGPTSGPDTELKEVYHTTEIHQEL